MKKLIYCCIMTVFVINFVQAIESNSKKTKIETEASNISDVDVKALSLRLVLPIEKHEFRNGSKVPTAKYLIGTSFCGNLAHGTNMIGFLSDPWVAGDPNCFMHGISLATVGQFHTINGLSMNLLSSYHERVNGFVAGTFNFNEEVNGVVFSSFGNIDKKVNGLALSLWINNHKEMNGIAFSLWCNGGFKDQETEKDSYFYEMSELNGLACGMLGNAYEDVNGILLSFLGNYAQQAVGIMGSSFNTTKSFTGYQFGGININYSTDTCLQAALLNLNKKTKNTVQFGFWNEIRDFESFNNMQFGFVNRSNSECFQLGLLNFSEKGFFKFFPFINF